jgi:hypothetical protein
MVSQTSVVSEPRTARAFSRAARRQLKMDDRLLSSATMNSMTLRPLMTEYLPPNRLFSSEMEIRLRQDCSDSAADWGCREV